MKMLHSADWHLNDQLGKQDRTCSLQKRVEQVAEICDREAIDVLLLAGDLFSEKASAGQVAESFRHLRQTFAAFFTRGGIILAVTGNHDQDGRVRPFIDLARTGMDLAEPPPRNGDVFAPGKMYLLDTEFVGRVRDRQGGFDVQFVFIPFPNHSRLLTGGETATTAGELQRGIQDRLRSWICELPHMPGYDPTLRTVLVAHLHVSGADVGGMIRMSSENEVLFDAAALPAKFDYVALGHIHKPQCLGGQAHVRYSGSLDRMNFGERDEEKGIVLVDIGPDGRHGDPQFIGIEPTPLIDLQITNPNISAEQLRAQVPDGEAIVRVIVDSAATTDGTGTLERSICETFPLAAIKWPELVNVAAARTVEQKATVRETVLEYLRTWIAEDDPDKADLLQLAGRFLEREEMP